MFKRTTSQIGIFFLYLLALLPLPVLYVFANGIYVLLYYVFGYRRAVVRENLHQAFPEKSEEEISQIEKKYYKYLSALIFEIIKMATISKAEVQKRFKYKNTEIINAYFERGESVLACSGHYGNWEWGTLSIGLSLKCDTYAIYKTLSNNEFDNWFHRIRTRFGNKLVPMRQTFRALTDSKGSPTMFLFGNDQAPPKSESHYWTEFLNQQTSIQQGMEKIAIKTSRPIFYIKVNVIKKGYYEVDFVPICLHPDRTPINEITQKHALLLEKLIQEEPAYWLWSHRRWKHQPTQQPEDLVHA
ncbi:lysophospholipid acyltransferase family protein [Pedobacter cryoconitis]|uniref:KDO2-lipid IV(A) lauroyltransferase n=1 Tax=Pedobacter cryoconitis TaxID=188932 RepID=A0A7X0J868_9SPHI|nr:lysophospholipid acyltransferase family protein [Pedobacter cryoconitis]MBB6502843.1 KDO2-lipid IV(A) lauroyltransferase [Pedobacter cryoconitis]